MTLVEQLAENGWSVVTSPCGGCLAARRGVEIHVHFTRTGVITRRKVREFLAPMLDELGFLTTRTPRADERSRRFVTRLGFKHTWSDDNFDYHSLTALPFSKER